MDAVADGGVGDVRDPRRRPGGRAAARGPHHPGRRLCPGRHRLRRSAELLSDGDLRRGPLMAALPRPGGPRRALRRGARDRQRRPRAGRRAGDDPHAGPLPRALRVAHPGGRLGAVAGACPGQRASGSRTGLRDQPRRRVAGLGAERRRWLGILAGSQLGHRHDRLGDAGPRGIGAQPARHIQARPQRRRLPARPCRRTEPVPATTPARSSPSRAPASTRTASAAATWSRRWSACAATTAPTKAGPARPRSR